MVEVMKLDIHASEHEVIYCHEWSGAQVKA